MKKSVFISITVVGLVAAASGIGVLIWWLVSREADLTTIVLEGDGFGDVDYSAALARTGAGDMFWWFFPSEGSSPAQRPLLLWLDGASGLPPSLLANLAMFGPLDFNLNRRNESWIDEYNLLFVDAPLGTGFSIPSSDDTLARNYDDTTDHLLQVLESFYGLHQEHRESPLHLFAQGDGAPLALALAARLARHDVNFEHRLSGLALGNPVVSPALVLTKLGFYLDEMGYIDPDGRLVVEEFTADINHLVDAGQLGEAFDKYITLESFINEQSGATAVNMGYILQKLTQDMSRDYNTVQSDYSRSALQLELDYHGFMVQTIAPALGIDTTEYNAKRPAALQALRDVYMEPVIHQVEYLLENTNIPIMIYNGNLDAMSTTPGQLEWVNNLEWYGASEFRNASRQTLVIDGLVEGYFRETNRLVFYWMNAAGISVPLDTPSAMRRILQRITEAN